MSSTARLVRFSLTEAAAQLSVTTTTLKKLLKGKGIEAALGGYTLKQLVAALMPDEGNAQQRSLAAHAAWQESKARLTQHELHEREGRFILKDEALAYLRSAMQAVYWSIYRLGLSKEDEEQVTTELHAAATEYWLRHGWRLEPQFTFSGNGDANLAEPVEAENRRLLWTRATNAVLASVATNGENEDGRAKDHTDAGRAGARRHRVRHPRANI
jgi:hypothetical protein